MSGHTDDQPPFGKSEPDAATHAGHEDNVGDTGDAGDAGFSTSGRRDSADAGAATDGGDAAAADDADDSENDPSPFGNSGEQGNEKAKQGGRRTQTQLLLDLAKAATLAHTVDEVGLARYPMQGHIETTELESRRFKQWLRYLYYKETGSAPQDKALNGAIGTLISRAVFDGPEVKTFIRVGFSDEATWYLDLGSADWSAIEITATGWRRVISPPVWFIRPADMQALPLPISGGSVEALRPFMNLRKRVRPVQAAKGERLRKRKAAANRAASEMDVGPDDDFILSIGFITCAFHPSISYPTMVLIGPQDAGKTTEERVHQRVMDPCLSETRELPTDPREIAVGAQRHWIQPYDNTSPFSDKINDALCRLATGGSRIDRELYTNGGEFLFQSRRPVILTGILDIVTRADLVSRAWIRELVSIPDEERKLEAEIWDAFAAAHPGILGSFLDALVHGLNQPAIRPRKLTRMADAVAWVSRCEASFGWAPGTFNEVCERNAANNLNILLGNDPVIEAIRNLMDDLPANPDGSKLWEGFTEGLLAALRKKLGDGAYRSRGLPTRTNVLSGCLRRAAPALRKIGITAYTWHTRKGSKVILFTPGPELGKRDHSAQTPSSARAARASQTPGPTAGEESGANFQKTPSPASPASHSDLNQNVTKSARDGGDDEGTKNGGSSAAIVTPENAVLAAETPPRSSQEGGFGASERHHRHNGNDENSIKSNNGDDGDGSDCVFRRLAPHTSPAESASAPPPPASSNHKAKKSTVRGRI
jgi:hypothetical protein